MSPVEGTQEPAVCEVDLVETIRKRLVVIESDLTVRFAHRSFSGTFAVTPTDNPREKEGRQ